MQKRWQLKSLFVKFFFSYMLFFIAAIAVISSLLFNQFSRSSVRQIEEISQKTLLQSRNSAEYMVNQAISVCSQISFDNDVIQQMNIDERDSLLENKVLRRLNDIIFINSSLHSICIYNAKTGVFLTTDYPNTEEEAVALLKEMDIRNYYQIVPRKLNLKDGAQENVYSVFYYDRDRDNDSILNAVIVNIKEEAVRRNINPDKKANQSFLLISDESGKTLSCGMENEILQAFSGAAFMKKILSSGKDGNFVERVGKEKSLIAHSFSDKLGWYFVYIIPYREATASISNLRNAVILICLLVMICSAVFSAFISGKLSSPFARLAGNILKLENPSGEVPAGAMNETEVLSNFYSRVSEKLEKLEMIKESSYQKLKDEYIREILQGIRLPREQDALDHKLSIGLTDGRRLCLAILMVDRLVDLRNVYNEEQSEEMNSRVRMAVCKVALEYIQAAFPCEAVEMDKAIVLALNVDSEEAENTLSALLPALQEKLKETLEISVTVAIGPVIENPVKIADAFELVQDIANYRMVHGEGSILTYEKVFAAINYEFDYPYQKEKNLLDSIRLGREEQVEPALEEIFNCLRGFLYDNMILSVNHLLFSVLVTAEMPKHHEPGDITSHYDKAFVKVRKLETLEQIKQWFSNYIRFSIQKAKESRKNSNPQLIHEIAKFVEANYFNASLSVEMAAETFNYNPIYFGKLFKELFNKSFLEYVSHLRIEKSKEYLREGKLTVKDISGRVGFNNPTYFVTCFRKSTGLAPSEYKKKQMGEG